jgi:NAD+ diphosphatase
MLPFTGNPLNRRSDKRGDAPWLTARLATARILPLWRGSVLTTGSPVLKAAAIPLAAADVLAPAGVKVFLGLDGETGVFAVDVSESEEAPAALAPFGEFRDLRPASLMLRKKDLAILSQAKGMIEWHAKNRFCPACGTATLIADGGNKRVCPACHTEQFPRTDPAVIMLATHGERCLLARNVKWTPDFYSCLAGFMEPGESLEEAVRRELFEEVGLIAGPVRYAASQPWPFPAALMIGCYAECETTDLTLDPAEIADAVWMTRREVQDLLTGAIEGRRGPMKSAVAWHLVHGWVEG